MLFVEQLRKIKDEKLLFDSDFVLGVGENCDWTEISSISISLSKASLVYIYTEWGTVTEGGCYGNGRILVDGNPLVSTGCVYTPSDIVTVKRRTFIYLGSGDHTIRFDASRFAAPEPPAPFGLKKRIISVLNFSDIVHFTDSGSQTISYGSGWNTIINKNFDLPTRKTPIGSINQYGVLIFLYLSTQDLRKNAVGEQDDRICWRIKIDGLEESAEESNNDYGTNQNLTYGEGAYAFLRKKLDAGSHNIKVEAKHNISGETSKTVEAYITLVACPWIIPGDDFIPVTLNFPPGSTLYVTTEPLHLNPTKKIKIGKTRFISFGDSTDFYKTVEGTGILNLDYTFDKVSVKDVDLIFDGYGGCISMIGVDVR